jgi:uncharacterized protein
MRLASMSYRLRPLSQSCVLGIVSIVSFVLFSSAGRLASAAEQDGTWNSQQAAKRMFMYYGRMSQPKPFTVRTGEAFKTHSEAVRQRILKELNLDRLPERIDLDPHYSDAKEHPWCTIRRVAIQLWPGVYSRCLLYMPRQFPEKPAPAALCPHGHEAEGYADPDLQKRFLMLAKLGYVVLATPQDHHEDILRGYSYQTYLTWSNMRALDFLETLPEVDRNRVGVSGLSGGGLQSQMIVALDRRIKAATIAGLTCDYREIIFPNSLHCHCNHWPRAMALTDQPEISALSCPTPVQYLTMNDWTAHFAADNFPTIQVLYRENGHPDQTEVVYWPSPHVYDRPKRERTYWWMEKWVRGRRDATIPSEPDDIQIISPAKAILQWEVKVPGERSFEQYTRQATRPAFQLEKGRDGWKIYRAQMAHALRQLLGQPQVLIPEEKAVARDVHPAWAGDFRVEEVLIPSEDHILVPTILIHPSADKQSKNGASVEVYLLQDGRSALAKNAAPYLNRARQGALVVLPDLRFSGNYAVERLADAIRPEHLQFRQASPHGFVGDRDSRRHLLADAWDRNGILWGRPIPGMMVTDLSAVLDFLRRREGTTKLAVRVTAADSAPLALAALLTACLDWRIRSVDADFHGHCYEKAGLWANDRTGLPNISGILRYGDVPQWLALLAGRQVTVRNLPQSDATRRWLEDVFAEHGNADNLHLLQSK